MVFRASLNPNRSDIQIGKDYQAEIPEIMEFDEDCFESETSQILWDPKENTLNEETFNTYLEYAATKNYNEFEALCLLRNTKMDTQRAVNLMDSYEPMRAMDKWTAQEASLFKSAYAQVGKNFSSMKSLFYNKTVNELVELYYHLKATKQIISPKETAKKKTVFPQSLLDKAKSNSSDTITLDMEELGERIVNSGEEVNLEKLDESEEIVERKKEIIDNNKRIMAIKETYFALKETKDLVLESALTDNGYLIRDKNGQLAVKEDKQVINTIRWEHSEVECLRKGLADFGRDWETLARIVKSKKSSQLKNFFEQQYEKLNLIEDYRKFLKSENGSDREIIVGDSGRAASPPTAQQNSGDEFVPSTDADREELTEIVEMEDEDSDFEIL